MIQLVEQLTALEEQAESERDSKYVRLVVDVANERVTDPATIHAALQTLDRDTAQLQRDLAAYREVRADFDEFSRLGERSAQQAASAQEAREADQRLTTARAGLISAQRAVESAERDYHTAQLAEQRFRAAVTDSATAGTRLMDDPSRLRFLPPTFRGLMERVHQLREERHALDVRCDNLRGRIYDARQRIADREQLVRHLRSVDYYSCVPSLDVTEIKNRQTADRETIGNTQSAIDADQLKIVEWQASHADAVMQRDKVQVGLVAAQTELAGALNTKQE